MSNDIVDRFFELFGTTPSSVIEIDNEKLKEIMLRKDSCGQYILQNQKIFGYEYRIMDKECFQIRYEFTDGRSVICSLEETIFVE